MCYMFFPRFDEVLLLRKLWTSPKSPKNRVLGIENYISTKKIRKECNLTFRSSRSLFLVGAFKKKNWPTFTVFFCTRLFKASNRSTLLFVVNPLFFSWNTLVGRNKRVSPPKFFGTLKLNVPTKTMILPSVRNFLEDWFFSTQKCTFTTFFGTLRQKIDVTLYIPNIFGNANSQNRRETFPTWTRFFILKKSEPRLLWYPLRNFAKRQSFLIKDWILNVFNILSRLKSQQFSKSTNFIGTETKKWH